VFVGTFERSLDDKGRLALPVSFRDLLGDTGYLAQMKGRLCLYSTEGFAEAIARLSQQAQAGEFPQDSLRVFSAGANVVKVDKQGRLTIPQSQRDAVKIEADTVVIGALNRIEIYRPDAWTQVQENSSGSEISGGAWL
jgi:MraZ protein